MPRDDDHIRRMYGEPDKPKRQPLNYGAIPALWILALVLFAAGSAIIALGSLWFAMNSAPGELEQHDIHSMDISPGDPR